MTREYLALTLDNNNRIRFKYFMGLDGRFVYLSRGTFLPIPCVGNKLSEELKEDSMIGLTVITDRKEMAIHLMMEELLK